MTGTRVVGITGSNGKTSVKDLAAAVVGTRLRTHASPASFNNEVGLPMTLLGADPRCRGRGRGDGRATRGTFGCSATSPGPTPSS